MRFVHRVVVADEPSVRATLPPLEPRQVEAGDTLIVVQVAEDDSNWPAAQPWVAAHRMTDILTTVFSDEELERAEWLELAPTWHQGYPQPDDEWEGITLDMSSYCQACHVGGVQNAPFRMKKEPGWGRNSFLCLNLVYDEFFVKPEVWERVFQPFGIPKRIVHNSKGQALKTVVQLDVTEPSVHIDTSSLTLHACSTCHGMRCNPFLRGMFPPLLERPSGDIARVHEWFGFADSGIVVRPLVVSQRLRQAMVEGGVRGMRFTPVASAT